MYVNIYIYYIYTVYVVYVSHLHKFDADVTREGIEDWELQMPGTLQAPHDLIANSWCRSTSPLPALTNAGCEPSMLAVAMLPKS